MTRECRPASASRGGRRPPVAPVPVGSRARAGGRAQRSQEADLADGRRLARYVRFVAPVVASAAFSAADAAPDSRSEEHALGSVPAGVEVDRGIEFSRDGARVAFVGSKDGKAVPVIDGKAFEPRWFVHAPRFSADGRVAFHVVEEPKKRTHVSWILLDGKRLPDSDGVDLLAWSPDGRRLAFTRFPECRIAADRSREGDCVLVVDGKKGGARSAISFVTWSADSKRVAEIAEETSKKPLVVHSVFVDGKSIASGSVYDGPVFSPDGTRVAYTAQLQRKDEPNPPPERIKWFVACGDQRLGLDFDAAGSPAFSPDGKRIAFKAEKAERVGISVDGAPPVGDWLFVTTPVWSSDGAHLAFVGSADCTVVPGHRVTRMGEGLVKG